MFWYNLFWLLWNTENSGAASEKQQKKLSIWNWIHLTLQINLAKHQYLLMEWTPSQSCTTWKQKTTTQNHTPILEPIHYSVFKYIRL